MCLVSKKYIVEEYLYLYFFYIYLYIYRTRRTTWICGKKANYYYYYYHRRKTSALVFFFLPLGFFIAYISLLYVHPVPRVWGSEWCFRISL
jgi:hypothetical protein